MIVESLTDWNRYDFGPTWKSVMQWVATHVDTVEDGLHDVFGCSAQVGTSISRAWGTARYEYHRRMADVQIVIEGQEDLHVLPARNLTPLAGYDPEADLGFFAEESRLSPVRLVPGLFALLFPWDAHMPLMAVSALAAVRKMVVKLPLSSLALQETK